MAAALILKTVEHIAEDGMKVLLNEHKYKHTYIKQTERTVENLH